MCHRFDMRTMQMDWYFLMKIFLDSCSGGIMPNLVAHSSLHNSPLFANLTGAPSQLICSSLWWYYKPVSSFAGECKGEDVVKREMKQYLHP